MGLSPYSIGKSMIDKKRKKEKRALYFCQYLESIFQSDKEGEGDSL